MNRTLLLLGLVLSVAAAPLDAQGGPRRTLVITYSDGHAQTVALERDAATILGLRFGPEPVTDLAGQWILRHEDPYAYYVIDAVLTPIGPRRWQVERTLRETNHGFHRTRVGATDRDCTISVEGERVVYICEGYDPNPSTQGRYRAEYEGRIDAQGVVRGSGRHAGGLTHGVSFEMRRR